MKGVGEGEGAQEPNQALAADRKRPRPLKSDVRNIEKKKEKNNG